MKLFMHFNPETGRGYITDTPDDGGVLAIGIVAYMAMYMVAALITAVIILPFFIACGLDKFLISFFSVNKNFIIGIAIALILIKFLTFRLSATLIVRFLFALLVVIPILYILLYKFHMADITISIGKKFELTNSLLKNTTVQSVWFESLLQNILVVPSKVLFYLLNEIKSIDYSAFSSSLSTINIVSVLVCIGKTLFWWVLFILFGLLISVVGLILAVIIVGFPYFVAFGVLILVNNLIYNIKHNYIQHLKF